MPSELRVVGLAEVAKILGVSKRTATRYVKRDDFPKPAAQLAMGPIWRAEDVEKWAGEMPVKRGRPRSAGNSRPV